MDKTGPVNSFQELMKKYGADQLYEKWVITCQTANKMLAGWPKNAEAELAMLEARARKGLVTQEVVDAAKARIAEAATKDPAVETEAASDKSTCVFKVVDDDRIAQDPTLEPFRGAIFVESRQIKAGLREAATTLGKTVSDWGSKQVIQHAMFARGIDHPDAIFFYRDGKILKGPDGTETMVAHITGPQGPRSTIKIHEYVAPGAEFKFELRRAASGNTVKVSEKDLVFFLTLCQDNGWGASRSQGFGRVEIVGMKQTAKVETPIYEKKARTAGKGKKADAEAEE
jgi:hypothetical protein